ncbi:MAG: response regulator [Deltaproteobacteria bacterium]|nr:response regulator [Deltaproteobacteria bacterium]
MKSKVLIIDDDQDIQEVMSAILEQEGLEVHHAEDGKEGVAKARETHPDVILLDVMMNYQDEGFQTAYELRSDPELAHTPIIMITSVSKVTGFQFDKSKDQDFLPVSDFIEKPVTRQRLLDAVRKQLGK